MAAELARALRSILGPDIASAGRTIAGPLPLWPEEAEVMKQAVPSRIAEFSSGRACAREAMRDLGKPDAAVPMASDRAPVWPAGLVGSISHGAGLCLAVVAEADRVLGLGIDIEPDDPLPKEVALEVLSPDERQGAGTQQRIAFSAKETVYKAFYPLTGQIWDFDAVHVEVFDAAFSARLTRPVPGWTQGAVVHGHVLRRDGVIVTALALTPPK